MADRHVIFKQCLKEVAGQHGFVSVTFMAKFAADRAGSSCHMHLSLWRDGLNTFAGDTTSDAKCSDTFAGSSAAGCARVPEVMVFYAPTVNSYKRYVDASWAPTRLAWSYDNRRPGSASSAMVVVADRVPDPGRRLQPVPRVRGRARLGPGRDRATGSSRPTASSATCMRHGTCRACRDTLREADRGLRRRANSRGSAFGDDVVDHYGHFFRTEAAAFVGGHRLGAPAILRAHLRQKHGYRQDKVALITGAGSGIGRGMQRRYSSRTRAPQVVVRSTSTKHGRRDGTYGVAGGRRTASAVQGRCLRRARSARRWSPWPSASSAC